MKTKIPINVCAYIQIFGDLCALSAHLRSGSYSWHLHVRCIFTKRKKWKKKNIFKINYFQYYMIVYFWITWWCYYIYFIFFYFTLLPKQVQTKNNLIFEYVSIRSVPFYVPKAIFSVMHIWIIVLSCWLLHVYSWFEYKFDNWIYICMCSMYGS